MKSYKWYANRLSVMSVAEVIHRGKTMAINSWDELQSGRFIVPEASITKTKWLWEIKDRTSFQHIPLVDVVNAAQRVMKGQDKSNWPESACFYDHCESNRHVYLVTLARAFFLTGEKSYKDEIERQLESWLADNPYKVGVNWKDALSMAVRLMAWSMMKGLCQSFNPELEKAWHESIFKHCYAISRNFASYSSANNHLIGEAAGLFIASSVWPFWPHSNKWQERAYNILLQEMETQIFPDGVNKEQAMAYQRTTLDLFLFPALIATVNGRPFPTEYWNGMERMMDYIASVMDMSGHVPDYGDGGYADQLVILSDNPNYNSYRSLLATGAVLFNRGDFKEKAHVFDEKSFWLLGPEGLEAFNQLPHKPMKTLTSFENAGYYILSDAERTSDEIKCIFDCGSLGFLSIAAHGHADALSFTLTAAGLEFFIDPGTYTYHHSERKWRNYFRGTGAHNTVRIDGVDQSISGGDFMWLKKAQASAIAFEETGEYMKVIGSHDGYMRLPDPVSHEREMILDKKKRTITIYDRFRAKGSHQLEQFFHLSKDCTIEKAGEYYEITNQGKRLRLRIGDRLKSEIMKGSIEPICGWQSPAFNIKHESPTIVNKINFTGDYTMETVIEILP